MDNSVVVKGEQEVATKEQNVSLTTVNQDVDLSFVYESDLIFGKVDKKGRFISNDKIYGDDIAVKIVRGKNRFVLWGKEETAQVGTILISEDTPLDAAKKFKEMCETIEDFEEQYSPADIQERYMLTVEILGEENGDEITFDLSFTNKLRFGQMGRKAFKGEYQEQGIPKNTPVSSCKVRMVTEEFQMRSGSGSYTGIKFEALSLL